MRAQEFILEYKLLISKDSDGVAIKATAGGKNLGHAEFFFDKEGRLDPQTVWVDERYHGQGIAADMYDYLKDNGYTIVRSWDQTDAGKGFWDKHRGEEATVWETNTQRQQLDFDEIYGKYLKVTDNSGDSGKPGFSLVTPLNGDSWNWRERPEFKALVKQKLNDPGFLGDHKYQQIIDSMSGRQFDSTKHIAKENFADGKVKGKSRPGRVKRAGASCAGSVTDLRKRAKNASGEKAKMFHWCANMKSGKNKAK